MYFKNQFKLIILIITLFTVFSNFLIAETSTNINFPDPALQAIIRKAINKQGSVPITNTDLKKLYVLRAGNLGITNLEGIQYCTSLRKLYLENNKLTNVDALAAIRGLTTLILSNNPITDINGVKDITGLTELALDYTKLSSDNLSDFIKLTNLENLSLNGLQIKNISHLSHMSKLVSLYISGNQIADVSYMFFLGNLQFLNLADNPLSEILNLTYLKKLTYLDLHNCQVEDISPLKNMIELTYLDISQNNISDLSALGNLEKINRFKAGNNQITDVSALFNMRNLQVAYLENNQISDITVFSSFLYLMDLKLNNNNLTRGDVLVPLNYTASLLNLDVTNNNMIISKSSENYTIIQNLQKNGVKINFQQGNILDVAPPVSFEDPALETAIRNSLDLTDDEPVTLEKLKNLTTLYADNYNIVSLKGIEYCTNLKTVHLAYNSIVDLSPLNEIIGTIKLLDIEYNNMDISLQTGTDIGKRNLIIVYKLVNYYNATVYCQNGNIF